jgi:hypothetical protein
MKQDLQRERQASSNALAMAQSAQRPTDEDGMLLLERQ